MSKLLDHEVFYGRREGGTRTLTWVRLIGVNPTWKWRAIVAGFPRSSPHRTYLFGLSSSFEFFMEMLTTMIDNMLVPRLLPTVQSTNVCSPFVQSKASAGSLAFRVEEYSILSHITECPLICVH